MAAVEEALLMYTWIGWTRQFPPLVTMCRRLTDPIVVYCLIERESDRRAGGDSCSLGSTACCEASSVTDDVFGGHVGDRRVVVRVESHEFVVTGLGRVEERGPAI